MADPCSPCPLCCAYTKYSRCIGEKHPGGRYASSDSWHRADAYAFRARGLVASSLLEGFDKLEPEDQLLLQTLMPRTLEDDPIFTKLMPRAVASGGPAAQTRNWLLLAAVAVLLLLCEYALPRIDALARAGKAARIGGRRQLYTAINLARTWDIRLRWRCCRRRPAFTASEVAPGLFLGSMADGNNLQALQQRGIVAVVTVSPGISPPFEAKGVKYLCLDVIDLPDEDLSGHFHAACAFVDQVLGTTRLYTDVDELWRGLRIAHSSLEGDRWAADHASGRVVHEGWSRDTYTPHHSW